MRLLRRPPDALTDEGANHPEQAAFDKTLREARLNNARAVNAWTEIQPTDLVTRARWQVHVPTDTVLAPHRGVVFEPSSATPLAVGAPLHFYVDDDGDLVFLERTGKTWSEIYLRQAQRERARR